jgi:hypothetical protein
MKDYVELLKTTPLWLLLVVVLAWMGRSWIEGALKSRFSQLESRMAASLDIKRGLRGHEQDELVEFRVAVETWEYFLQTGIGDLTMASESQDFDPVAFHDKDRDLFGAVRMAAVKASIFLRDGDLETELLKTISAIRGMYYPHLETAMRELLELQGQMLPYLTRMRQFEASGLKDVSVALNAQEAQVLIGLRHQATASLQTYAQNLIANYRPIAEQLYDLKARINVHIYRPLTSAEIDKEAR